MSISVGTDEKLFCAVGDKSGITKSHYVLFDLVYDAILPLIQSAWGETNNTIKF